MLLHHGALQLFKACLENDRFFFDTTQSCQGYPLANFSNIYSCKPVLGKYFVIQASYWNMQMVDTNIQDEGELLNWFASKAQKKAR